MISEMVNRVEYNHIDVITNLVTSIGMSSIPIKDSDLNEIVSECLSQYETIEDNSSYSYFVDYNKSKIKSSILEEYIQAYIQLRELIYCCLLSKTNWLYIDSGYDRLILFDTYANAKIKISRIVKENDRCVYLCFGYGTFKDVSTIWKPTIVKTILVVNKRGNKLRPKKQKQHSFKEKIFLRFHDF